MANAQPTLRYETTGTGEDVRTTPILTGYNDAGATGYFTQKPLYGGESDNFYEYVWNPASYEYSKEALNNPDLPYLNASPEQYQSLYDLKTANPTEYTAKLAEGISNSLFNNYSKNKNTSGQLDALEAIKDVNPQAYYNAQLKYLGQQMGWQIGQNTSERNTATEAKLQELIPQAMAAGISPEQINSLVGTSLNNANSMNQQRIATAAADGGGGFNFAKDILPGIKFVGGAAAAMTGLGAGLEALSSGSGFGMTAPSLASGLEIPVSSALTGTGAGAAAVPAGGSLASLGSLGWTAPTIGGSAGFLAPVLGANAASTGIGLTASQIPSLISGLEVGTGGVLGSMPYASDAIKGLTAKELLNYAGTTAKGLGLAQSLLGGGSSKPTFDPSQLARALGSSGSSGMPSSFAGQIKANQNPFTFASQGQTVASPNMYDVSGSNIANALRKA